MTDFPAVFDALNRAGVEFVLIGGAAAAAHGSLRLTQVVDIAYRRTPDNIRRLVRALAPLKPYLRGAPPGLPFVWEERTAARGLNFTLTTAIGEIDLLGEVTGGGAYEELLPYSVRLEPFGEPCLCVTVEELIVLKRAAGRPKDLEAIAELELILERLEG